MLWTMVLGIGLVFGAQYLSNLPYSVYPKSDFWLNSPGLILIKLGVVLITLAMAFLWINVSGPQRWSLFRQLGMTSLLVYWVHIELVYGRWFGIWKEAMTVRQVLTFTVVLLGLLTVLSIFQTRGKFSGTFFKALPIPVPRRASGD
jgi:fucose 4-O-acetylase-like acetyltransferase